MECTGVLFAVQALTSQQGDAGTGQPLPVVAPSVGPTLCADEVTVHPPPEIAPAETENQRAGGGYTHSPHRAYSRS